MQLLTSHTKYTFDALNLNIMRSGYVTRTGRYSNRVDERSLLYAERMIVFVNCPDNSSRSEMGATEYHAGDTHHQVDIRLYSMRSSIHRQKTIILMNIDIDPCVGL